MKEAKILESFAKLMTFNVNGAAVFYTLSLDKAKQVILEKLIDIPPFRDTRFVILPKNEIEKFPIFTEKVVNLGAPAVIK